MGGQCQARGRSRRCLSCTKINKCGDTRHPAAPRLTTYQRTYQLQPSCTVAAQPATVAAQPMMGGWAHDPSPAQRVPSHGCFSHGLQPHACVLCSRYPPPSQHSASTRLTHRPQSFPHHLAPSPTAYLGPRPSHAPPTPGRHHGLRCPAVWHHALRHAADIHTWHQGAGGAAAARRRAGAGAAAGGCHLRARSRGGLPYGGNPSH